MGRCMASRDGKRLATYLSHLFLWYTYTSLPAGGEKFHLSFLTFFRLYVRLFLNSFGIHPSMLPVSVIHCDYPHEFDTLHRAAANLQAFKHYPFAAPALLIHCESSRKISTPSMYWRVTTLFLTNNQDPDLDSQRYGQDSITVMTAYSAIFLLKAQMPFYHQCRLPDTAFLTASSCCKYWPSTRP